LPRDRRERRKVVLAVPELDPRQSVATEHVASLSSAQRATAIAHADLRQHAKHCAPSAWHAEEEREHARHHARAHEARDRALLRDDGEATIRGRDEPARKRDTLRLVRI